MPLKSPKRASAKWQEFAQSFVSDIGPITLIDSSRSLRDGKTIYVNIRRTHKRIYKRLVEKFNKMFHRSLRTDLRIEEVFVIRFLHELGHVYLQHPGNPNITEISRDGRTNEEFERQMQGATWKDSLKDALTNPSERAAWRFALDILDKDPRFEYLVKAIKMND